MASLVRLLKIQSNKLTISFRTNDLEKLRDMVYTISLEKLAKSGNTAKCLPWLKAVSKI